MEKKLDSRIELAIYAVKRSLCTIVLQIISLFFLQEIFQRGVRKERREKMFKNLFKQSNYSVVFFGKIILPQNN